MSGDTDAQQLPEEDCWCYEVLVDKETSDSSAICFNTYWVGFADQERRIELREPRPLSRNDLIKRRSPYTGKLIEYVSTRVELVRLLIVGGHAAIDQRLAQTEIADYLKAEPVTTTGYGPFIPLPVPMSIATTPAPTKALRMKIFKRDQYRCKICGQRPSEDANVILHIHHIRPWANLGATVPSNLITICQTCHMGLEPHYDPDLADLIKEPARLVG